MAEDAEGEVQNALNLVVCTVEQSSNMRKTLKQKIFETVSTLRTPFAKLKYSGNRKSSKIKELTKQVDEMGTQLKLCRETLAKEHRAPSIGEGTEQEKNIKRGRSRHPPQLAQNHPAANTVRGATQRQY